MKKKISEKQKQLNKENRNKERLLKYRIYRDLGYSASEARKLRSKKIDVNLDNIEVENGKVKNRNNYYKAVRSASIIKYGEDVKDYQNDTVYSKWGMLTQDNRYRDDTARMAKYLQKNHKLSNDQSYYFLYTMLQNNLSYGEAKEQLLSNKEFEMYDKNKKNRKR